MWTGNRSNGVTLLTVVSTIPKRTSRTNSPHDEEQKEEGNMRGYYLENKKQGLEDSGARGGVGTAHTDGRDYELEVGAKMNASGEMIALLVHYDEVMEFLEKSDSALATLLLDSIKRKTAHIYKDLVLNLGEEREETNVQN
tara:strand:- start:61 stop:483 length:423 start_codon:yes stop_codon:yes gene_type:complete